MKNKICLLLFLSITSLGFSQSLEQLKTEAKQFYEAQYNMDFEKIVSYMHPNVFNRIDKESLLNALDQSYQNEQFRMRLVFPKTTFTFSEIIDTEGKKICKIEYPQTIRMIFEKPLSEEEKSAIEQSILTSKPSLKLRFEKDRNAFFIEGSEILLAISDEATLNQWKLMMYDPSQKQEFAIMLGENVITLLGL